MTDDTESERVVVHRADPADLTADTMPWTGSPEQLAEFARIHCPLGCGTRREFEAEMDAHVLTCDGRRP